MPSSGRSGPEAPSALLSEGQCLPSSAARRLARSGMYALAASFLLRLPTVRLYEAGEEEEDGNEVEQLTVSCRKQSSWFSEQCQALDYHTVCS